jgi:hypothetical protein
VVSVERLCSLGKYCQMRPLVFSLVPRPQEEYGEEHVFMVHGNLSSGYLIFLPTYQPCHTATFVQGGMYCGKRSVGKTGSFLIYPVNFCLAAINSSSVNTPWFFNWLSFSRSTTKSPFPSPEGSILSDSRVATGNFIPQFFSHESQ